MAHDPMDHPKFQKTMEAHEAEMFGKRGCEPTNFGADVNASEPKKQSWIMSKTNKGNLHTFHDHKTGRITHTWSHTHVAEEVLDELNYKAILQRYRAKAKSKERAKTADSAKKPVVAEKPKKAVNEEPVEYYDHLERKRKADWHYKRAGKSPGASLSKGIKHDYEAELLRRGVKDSNGNQKSLRKESIVDLVMTQDEIEYDVYREDFEGRINAMVDEKKQEMKQDLFNMDEAGFANRFAPLKKTTPVSGYGRDKSGGAAFMSSNPDMRINRRAGLDKDIDWKDDGKEAYAKQQAKAAKFKKIAQQRSGK